MMIVKVEWAGGTRKFDLDVFIDALRTDKPVPKGVRAAMLNALQEIRWQVQIRDAAHVNRVK